MPVVIMLPGLGGSGPCHWQSRWESADGRMRRFCPASWDRPDRTDWSNALDTALTDAAAPVLLVAHSLACLLVAHWAATRPARLTDRVTGAFLVAVPDPDAPSFPAAARSFVAPPMRAFPFPGLIVASSDDPYGAGDHACECADRWGCGLLSLGALGHINAASGLGEWTAGRNLLTAFEAGTRVTRAKQAQGQ